MERHRQVHLWVNVEDYEALQRVAVNDGASVSAVMRRIIKRHLRVVRLGLEAEPPPERAPARAGAAIGPRSPSAGLWRW